jgi:hypothetical protein
MRFLLQKHFSRHIASIVMSIYMLSNEIGPNWYYPKRLYPIRYISGVFVRLLLLKRLAIKTLWKIYLLYKIKTFYKPPTTYHYLSESTR